MKMKSLILLMALIGLVINGCGDKDSDDKQTTHKEEKPKPLNNFVMVLNDDSQIIINQKIPDAPKDNFKNIEPKDEQESILKDFIITSPALESEIKILYFFTTWCEPCIGILPHLDNLQKQFGDKIKFIGIPLDDILEKTENFPQTLHIFVEENAITFPMVEGSERQTLFRALGEVEGIPLMALYDNNGDYLIHYLGAIPEEMLEFDLSYNLTKLRAK